MEVALAAAPILALLVLILGLRWSAAAAGAAAAAFALLIALAWFGLGGEAPLAAVTGAAAEAAFSAASILWIIFAALAIHEYQLRSGAIETFRARLAGMAGERHVGILLIVWFFALFLEGAAGFGAPVALAAPLLVGLGVAPERALAAVLVGHAAGVSFGAVGTPILPLQAAAPGDGRLVTGIALVHGLLGWMLALIAVRIASFRGGRTARDALIAAGIFLVPYVIIAWAVGPELPTLAAAALGGAAFAAVKGGGGGHGRESAAALASAAAAYLLVILLVLVTRLIPAVREAAAGLEWSWRLPGGFGGSVAPFYHPGTLLLLSLLGAAMLRGGGNGALRPALGAALARLPRVAIALTAVLLAARLMVHSGMIDLLARASAARAGGAWPALAPALGALGAFVTGSATASNILFAPLQQAAAIESGTAPLLAGVGQGVGAAVGNMIAPHNIVAGAATVGLVGAEGRVLRRTLPACLLYLAAAGALLWTLSSLGAV